MRIGVLTGGGDCPGLNPAIRGFVLKALDYGYECIGFLNGWKGLVEGASRPLVRKDVEDIIAMGGTGSLWLTWVSGEWCVERAGSST